jgi:glutamate-5-semialdehyde dehydrogenase
MKKGQGKTMSYLDNIGSRAKAAASKMNLLGITQKNEGLEAVAEALLKNEEYIMDNNLVDIMEAEVKNVKASLVDRLRLTHDRIKEMANGLLQIASLDDPVGEVISMKTRPNGLRIGKKVVPIGVIGIIYESRPNVTADAFGLCFKTGNAVILRGGSDAINSNKAIVKVIRDALASKALPTDSIILLEDTSREMAQAMMRLNAYIDVLIPRGGAGLIKTVVETSTIPVIETGTGNCHIYIDEFADLEMAVDIVDNAKTQRLGVCNTCESLVVHQKVANQVVPMLYDSLQTKKVVIRGDERAINICPELETATEEDWGREYLDAMISLKIVDSIEEGIEHINKYNTKHSEAIITKDYHNSMKFLNEIDASAVYVNASTRFTDGFEFGFGAEIGISTQKLHARGPMGLSALTTTKYIIFGDGQIRK